MTCASLHRWNICLYLLVKWNLFFLETYNIEFGEQSNWWWWSTTSRYCFAFQHSELIHWKEFLLYWFVSHQTLLNVSLSGNCTYFCAMVEVVQQLRHGKVIHFSFFFCLSLYFFRCSPHWTFQNIAYKINIYTFWLKYWLMTRWPFSQIWSSHLCILVLQTLIDLDLSSNQIEENGAQHLGNALRNNTVALVILIFIWSQYCLNLDTLFIEFEYEPNWKQRFTISCWLFDC
jgi:hypothetical protein